jgi:hypothetical protein
LYDISQTLSAAAKVQGSALTTEELETVAEELEFASETLEELFSDGLDFGAPPSTLEDDSMLSVLLDIGFEESSPQAIKLIAVERAIPKPIFL